MKKTRTRTTNEVRITVFSSGCTISICVCNLGPAIHQTMVIRSIQLATFHKRRINKESCQVCTCTEGSEDDGDDETGH